MGTPETQPDASCAIGCSGGGAAPFRGIVAGFGIPGREVANLFQARGIPFCVIELNPETVRRCSAARLQIIQGDVTDEAVLRRAGIEHAEILALAIPDDNAAMKAIAVARRLNPGIHIIVRCHRVSTGFEASRLGANEVVVEEQITAQAMTRLLAPMLPPAPTPAKAS